LGIHQIENLSFNAEIAESQRAYVKIEARILALLVREGITFVLFAAYIPAIAEPFGARAFVGEYSFARPARLGKVLGSFWGSVRESCRYTKAFAAFLHWLGRQFRQRGSRIRT
jgi:hypothetical protein